MNGEKPSQSFVVFVVIVFSAAMGFLESAVVVYLRQIYYPGGFDFPLKVISGTILTTEILREAMTLVMLLTVTILAGRTGPQRFAFFLIAFAVWDIFYYVFLYLLLGWPASLFTWDILFLIPMVWVGPVLAPVICSLTMILLALRILAAGKENRDILKSRTVWIFLLSGCLLILVSFMEEYFRYIFSRFSWGDLFDQNLSGQVKEYAMAFIPRHFRWWIFLAGEVMLIGAVIWVGRNPKLKGKNSKLKVKRRGSRKS